MSLQRAIFAVTCDSNGQGSADVTLKLPSTLTRHAQLVMVTVDVSAAAGKTPMVAVSQLDDVSSVTYDSTGTAHVAGTDYALGAQLFYVEMANDPVIPYPKAEVYEFDPRHAVINADGSSPTYATITGFELIRTKKLRCEVYGANSADVVTVNVYYETAGDWRF
jgi:hypothetical protein